MLSDLTCVVLQSTSELYDEIHFELKEKPGVSVKAAKDIWDDQSKKPHETLQPPALPPKGHRNTPVCHIY